jgi:hypothetical protein
LHDLQGSFVVFDKILAIEGKTHKIYTTRSMARTWRDMQVVDPGKKSVADAAIGEKPGKEKSGDNFLANRNGHLTFPAASRPLVGDMQKHFGPLAEIWSGAMSNIRADAGNEMI